MSGFQVQRQRCATCIYRRDLGWDIAALEAQCADPHMVGFFSGYRECHHAEHGSGVCCRGFWDHHKDAFAHGQLAQRLDCVEFVEVDVMK